MSPCAADLHVHTALSPCAGDEMTPPAIVARALDAGLAMIAICDHNSARNAAAVQRAAGERLAVLAGVEITSAEECHVVGLFPDARAAEAASANLGARLPQADEGYTQYFGEQLVLDARGEVLDHESLALAAATPFDVAQCVALVHRHGGIAVAAHVDRPHFGVIGQLGVFPHDAGFDAVELSRHVAAGTAEEERFAGLGLPLFRSSDAHYLDDVGAARTALDVPEPTFASLAALVRAGATVGGGHA